MCAIAWCTGSGAASARSESPHQQPPLAQPDCGIQRSEPAAADVQRRNGRARRELRGTPASKISISAVDTLRLSLLRSGHPARGAESASSGQWACRSHREQSWKASLRQPPSAGLAAATPKPGPTPPLRVPFTDRESQLRRIVRRQFTGTLICWWTPRPPLSKLL